MIIVIEGVAPWLDLPVPGGFESNISPILTYHQVENNDQQKDY
jgi:hypothetical protein